MCKQLSLLPLMNQYDKEGFIRDTTYFEIEACGTEPYHLVFNINTYSLFIPDGKSDWLVETVEAESVIITKGSYNGKDNCLELMFADNTKTLFTIIVSEEQFTCESPLKEGWNGELYIFVGSIRNCIQKFENVYYRVANNLPFGRPVEQSP